MTTAETNILRAAFLVSLLATMGSLFFSEVMKLPPCSLCWYQRICMYPLVYIFGLGLFRNEKECFRYATGLVGLGLAIAVYHNLLYYGIIPESIAPCTQGIPCSARLIEWFGFLGIPQLSLISFSLLTLLLFLFFKNRGVPHETK